MSKQNLCRIADLIVDIPAVGDMISRCSEYLIEDNVRPDIVVNERLININAWPEIPKDMAIYMETGFIFYAYLLKYAGMMLHSSAIEIDKKAYLFAGPSGVGKSTHTRLLKEYICSSVEIFNDDKPAIRKIDNKWFTYGTPWCGKDGINKNERFPLGGICFLKKGAHNRIRRIAVTEAVGLILSQTLYKFKYAKDLDILLNLVDQLVRDIPIYELTNNATPESAILSYETMRRGAEEAGL